MKRHLLTLLVAVAAVPVTASIASAQTTPRAQLRGFQCQRAIEPSQRLITVEALMRPVRGTVKMALRFELLSRLQAGSPVTEVAGHDLGNWVSPSNPTLGQRPGDVWIVDHPVVGLDAPLVYRFRITFRWTGAHGRVLGSLVRVTATCFQPELRPDLLVQSITVEPTSKPAINMYVAQIANDGATGAGPFEVLFAPGGGNPVKTHTVNRLGPHSTRSEIFLGPACSITIDPTVTVDPLHQVDDLNPNNNSLTATCPSSGPA